MLRNQGHLLLIQWFCSKAKFQQAGIILFDKHFSIVHINDAGSFS